VLLSGAVVLDQVFENWRMGRRASGDIDRRNATVRMAGDRTGGQRRLAGPASQIEDDTVLASAERDQATRLLPARLS